MNLLGSIQILLVVGIVSAIGIPFGGYLYRVFTGEKSKLEVLFSPVERFLYKLSGINPSVQMDWKGYVKSLLLINLLMVLFVYLIFRLQGVLPLNPDHIPSMPWDFGVQHCGEFYYEHKLAELLRRTVDVLPRANDRHHLSSIHFGGHRICCGNRVSSWDGK